MSDELTDRENMPDEIYAGLSGEHTAYWSNVPSKDSVRYIKATTNNGGDLEGIIGFLLGSNHWSGIWFSQKNPDEKGAFWWRKHLRKFVSQQAASISEKDKRIAKLEGVIKNLFEGDGTMNDALAQAKEALKGGDA